MSAAAAATIATAARATVRSLQQAAPAAEKIGIAASRTGKALQKGQQLASSTRKGLETAERVIEKLPSKFGTVTTMNPLAAAGEEREIPAFATSSASTPLSFPTTCECELEEKPFKIGYTHGAFTCTHCDSSGVSKNVYARNRRAVGFSKAANAAFQGGRKTRKAKRTRKAERTKARRKN